MLHHTIDNAAIDESPTGGVTLRPAGRAHRGPAPVAAKRSPFPVAGRRAAMRPVAGRSIPGPVAHDDREPAPPAGRGDCAPAAGRMLPAPIGGRPGLGTTTGPRCATPCSGGRRRRGH